MMTVVVLYLLSSFFPSNPCVTNLYLKDNAVLRIFVTENKRIYIVGETANSYISLGDEQWINKIKESNVYGIAVENSRIDSSIIVLLNKLNKKKVSFYNCSFDLISSVKTLKSYTDIQIDNTGEYKKYNLLNLLPDSIEKLSLQGICIDSIPNGIQNSKNLKELELLDCGTIVSIDKSFFEELNLYYFNYAETVLPYSSSTIRKMFAKPVTILIDR